MGEVTSAKFQLRLLGGFCLRNPEGHAIDIPSKKGRALLALLATAENGERTRSWLQDRLWSRGSSKDSLRKELSSLRALLGTFGLDPLPKDAPRDVVQLNLDRFEIDARDPNLKPRGEFLEGLDIPHENSFEDWLRETRAYFDSLIPDPAGVFPILRKVKTDFAPERLSIGISPINWDTASQAGDLRQMALNDILDRIVKSLLYTGGVEVFDYRFRTLVPNVLNVSASHTPEVLLLPRVIETSSRLVLTLELMRNETGQVLCSRRSEFDTESVSRQLEDQHLATQLVAEAVDEILFTLQRHTPGILSSENHGVISLVNDAITGMFELTFSGLDKARSNLDRAAEIHPNSVIYAWRSYLSAHQVDDPRIADLQQIQAEARYFARRAIELDRYNPLTLSLLTHVHAFTLREFDIASDYMQQAKSLRSDHIMTYDSDALLNLYLGNLSQSRQSALQAIRLSRFLPFKYIFFTTLCMIEARAGNYDSSIVSGEKSLRLQPASLDRPYPPTIRYLAESYARQGKKEKAFELIRNLQNSGQGFSVKDRSAPTPQIKEFLQITRSSAS